jgi:hypothetical protein
MKRCRVLLLSLFTFLLVLPSSAYADTIRYTLSFFHSLNQYKVGFSWPTGSTAYRVHFTADSGAVYDLSYENPPTGIFYLTCNGVYQFYFYDTNGTVIGSFMNIRTTLIQNPPCQSYPEQTGKNDLNAQVTTNPDGTYRLTWDANGTNEGFDIYKDGQQLESDFSGGTYDTIAGSYTIVRKDRTTGNVTGVSDINAPSNYSPTSGTSGNGNTDGTGYDPSADEECATLICQCISELKPVLNDIDAATEGTFTKVGDLLEKTDEVKTAIEQVKQSVDGVKSSVESLHEEFKTTNNYTVKPLNGYPEPNLNDDKPPMRTETFTDSNTYFTDKGDAEEPQAFPNTPEPSNEWKTGNGDQVVQKESQLTQEQPMQREEESVLDSIPERDAPLVRDPVPEKDETIYPLRWKSDQYTP